MSIRLFNKTLCYSRGVLEFLVNDKIRNIVENGPNSGLYSHLESIGSLYNNMRAKAARSC